MSWKDAYLEGRILSANPLELVSLLYQGALDAAHDARQHLADGDIPARSKAISKITDILIELESSLNHQAGGSISRGLADLYQYMRLRLLEANIRRDDAILAEVQTLLATMAEAWRGIQQGPAPKSVAETEAAVGHYPTAVWDGAFEGAHSWSA